MRILKLSCFVLFLFCFMGYSNVWAESECDTEKSLQLQKDAFNINANYEIMSRVEDLDGNVYEDLGPEDAGPSTDYLVREYVQLEIRNITKNLVLRIENSTDRDDFEVSYEDTDKGTYIFEVPDTMKIREYKIHILSNDEDCLGEEISSKSVITPKKNILSSYSACLEMDAYYCEPYITTEIYMSEDELQEKYDEYQEQKAQQIEEEEQKKAFPWWIVGVIVGVLVVAILLFIVIRFFMGKIKRSKIL